MAILTIRQNQTEKEIYFEGKGILNDVLREAGCRYAQPCGGRGVCGKCAVEITGAVSEPNSAEKRVGKRLSCQAVLLGDAQVVLPDCAEIQQIEFGEECLPTMLMPMEGRYGAAVDIGTTTLVLKVYELSTGKCVGTAVAGNPQVIVAADVIGRIDASMKGQKPYLKELITKAMDGMLRRACQEASVKEAEVDVLVVSGNTTMLYLLTGRDTASLSCAPFEADWLFDEQIRVLGRKAYLPPCMNAFVGADITGAVMYAGMCKKEEISLLCDIGTNGEIALWKEGKLYVASTAAGPAFEGAGISCGCGSVNGAIDKVWVESGVIKAHTIGNAQAVGVCGSGLIDALAAMLKNDVIDETGAMEAEAYMLEEGIFIRREDVREIQLAKAAIAAGIDTLLETAGVSVDEIANFYLAGGFGSHMNVSSAIEIGLIPEGLQSKVHVLGNAAVAGAAQLLLERNKLAEVRSIAECAVSVNLGGNEVFNGKYIDKMFF